MRQMAEMGHSQGEIATVAGVCQSAISQRLKPGKHQRYGETHRSHNNDIAERGREAQDETKPLAKKKSASWTQEDLNYLRKHGATQTALELAFDLGRTFYAVRSAAKRYKIPLRKP